MFPQRIRFTDGTTRNVYVDGKGEYVVDVDGERVYGQWTHPDAPPRRLLFLITLAFVASVLCASTVWSCDSTPSPQPQHVIIAGRLELELLREGREQQRREKTSTKSPKRLSESKKVVIGDADCYPVPCRKNERWVGSFGRVLYEQVGTATLESSNEVTLWESPSNKNFRV